MSLPPPPPPPTGGLPPPPLPPGGGPAVSSVTIIAPVVPPQRQRQPAVPLPTTVLLTNIPIFLRSSTRSIRDWIGCCGSARTVQIIPKPKRQQQQQLQEEKKPEDIEAEKATIATALITFGHADAALRFITAFKNFKTKLDEETKDDDKGVYTNFQAYTMPVNPDIPLPPPPPLDKASVETLGNRLWKAWEAIESNSGGANYNKNIQSSFSSSANAPTTNTMTTSAGGKFGIEDEGEEEMVDPLETPHVLEAVHQFRMKLEKLQGGKASRRKELVAEKLAQLLPVIRKRMKEQQAQAQQAPPPPPPPPTGNVPPPSGLPPPPPPPPPPGGAGRGGISNLPAWMTKQQQQGGGLGEEPPTKKAKLDDSSDQQFPPLPASTHDKLRSYITSQIQKYLGEEDVMTLIDFVYGHVLECKAKTALLIEVKEVLGDEDGTTFFTELQNYITNKILLS